MFDDYFLVDQILPAQAVHLFGGPSGAGKTRLSFQWVEDLCQGRPIMTYQVIRPLLVGYVAMDRPIRSIHRTLKDLGINPNMTNFICISCSTKQTNLAQVPFLFGPRTPDLIIIDGIPTLLPSGDINKYSEVASFLRLCQKICDDHNTTIIGLLHATKTKEHERYLNPRQRIAGSIAWAAYSETIFLLEPIKAEDTNDHRRVLNVLPRNSAEFHKDFTFDPNGRLIELAVQEEQDKYELLLAQIPAKPTPRDHILDLALSLGIGKTQCDAWLAKSLEDGRLIKPERGHYQRGQVN